MFNETVKSSDGISYNNMVLWSCIGEWSVHISADFQTNCAEFIAADHLDSTFRVHFNLSISEDNITIALLCF